MNTFINNYSQVESDTISELSRDTQFESSLYLSANQEYDEDNLDIQPQHNIKLNIKDDLYKKENSDNSHNLEVLNLSKLQLNDSNDEPFDFFRRNTNSTLGKKHKTSYIKLKPNNNNKYVDESTLNSYQSIAALKDNVTENVDVCRQNIYKVKERNFKLENLEEKSELLIENSEFFRKQTVNLNWKIWLSTYLFHVIGILFFIGTITFLIIKLS
tara:strand:+ start:144 stop:785 length:642 start_codon:yes stop_codon:yes gene_type:complete